MAPMAPREGNTKLPARMVSVRPSSSKRWTFTAFNMDGSNLIGLIGKLGKYVFGYEKCPETKKDHLQGYIEFEIKCRPLEKVKSTDIHWEKSKGSRDENVKYCTKDGKYETNSPDWIPEQIEDWYDVEKELPWQREILETVKQKPDRRKLYWYWESNGGTGKSTLLRHMQITYGDSMLLVAGKSADVKYGVTKQLEKGTRLKIVCWNLPRTMEEFVSYAAIEEVKDAHFFSTKFESGMALYNPPHVIIMANFKPNIAAMSRDRWVIREIK